MPVDSCHPDYEIQAPKWQRCRDCISGQDAVHHRRTDYLPLLAGQDRYEYDAYVKRSVFYGATGRTVQGLLGSVFRKPATINFPDEEMLKDITQTGLSFEAFAQDVVSEQLSVGRVGVLVDVAPGAVDGAQPYLAMYTAESIINWRIERIGSRQMLRLVVLQETVPEYDPSDEFEPKLIDQFRVLRLDNGIYRQEIWRKREGVAASADAQWYIEQTINPRRAGQSLDEIPFTIIGADSATPDMDKPPLLDLVDMNLSHYRTTADLEHGAHFTALPTPWVAGFSPDTPLKIGSGVAWVAPDPSARAGYLEFSGAGLGKLETIQDKKETQMAVLGARMLEKQMRGREAAETVRLRQSGETSALSGIVNAADEGLTYVLKAMARWMSQDDANIQVSLNKDFLETVPDAPTLTLMMQALQGGLISFEVWFDLLAKGDFLPADTTIDILRERIAAQRETLMPGATVPPAGP